MIVAGLIWAAIAWADTADFKVQKPSGKYETVTVDEDDTDTYKTYRYDGATKEGRSVASVLKEVGIGNRLWTSITVDGLTVKNGEFPNKKPPIFIVRGDDDLTFYRPKTADDAADTRNGIAVMTMRAPIDIDASDNSPKAGQTVTYTASVRGGGTGNYEFTWTPSSGTGGTGSTFKYTYPESSGEVSINVTAKRGSDDETVGTATAATHDIEYTPPSSNNSGFGGTGYSPGYSPPSTDYNYDYNFPDSAPSQDIPDTKVPEAPEPDETVPLEDLGTPVEGELLSTVAALPPSSGDASAASPVEEDEPNPEEAMEEAEEISAPGALIAGGIVVGLLGLGAGREMENVRPRRLRRPNLSGLRRLSPPWK